MEVERNFGVNTNDMRRKKSQRWISKKTKIKMHECTQYKFLADLKYENPMSNRKNDHAFCIANYFFFSYFSPSSS